MFIIGRVVTFIMIPFKGLLARMLVLVVLRQQNGLNTLQLCHLPVTQP